MSEQQKKKEVQKLFKIERTSQKPIESKVGIIQGSQNNGYTIELDLSTQLADFVKEQGQEIIFSKDDNGLITMEIYDYYRE